MKDILGHISYLVITTLCALCFGSCVNDHYPDEGNSPGIGGGVDYGDRALIVLHIAPLDAVGASSTGITPTEKIKSLRIIIIDKETNAIECNRLVESENASVAAIYKYVFTWPTTPGEKEIYLIGNERSVGTFSYYANDSSDGSNGTNDSDGSNGSGGTNDSGGASDKSLTALLDGLTDASILQSIYFKPEYVKDENGDICLPYTSHYTIVAGEKTMLERTMYLVPVATKFTFKFTNERKNRVNISEITLHKTNTENFLLAHFNGVEDTKKYLKFADDGEKYYWIDWLAEIAEKPQEEGGSMEFNNLWIDDYKMPTEEKPQSITFVSDKKDENGESDEEKETFVPEMTVPGTNDNENNEETPGKLDLGPFYVPESRAFYVPESQKEIGDDATNADNEDITKQQYGFTLTLTDTKQGVDNPLVFNLVIENLKALFRNTHVIININMTEGDVKVYAEIASWSRKRANGWVLEGSAPAP